MNIQALITDKITQVMQVMGAPADIDAHVRQSTKPQFGDYQVNGIMSMAKKMNRAPRELAQEIVKRLDLDGLAEKIEVAGPGFINIFLSTTWLEKHAEMALSDSKLSVTPVIPQTIVVDYSAPNVAKEMHVGHLRSTIIGDAVVRTLQFLGHHVIRANHIGDWGTQFGMLIAYLEKIEQEHDEEWLLSSLEEFYRQAKQTYDQDEKFAEHARHYVVKLQGGDEYCLSMWRKLVHITVQNNQRNYERLNVTLTDADVMGESLYNPMLPGIVADLQAQGLATSSEGAIVVFLDEFKNKDGEPMGVIIQKRDGAYLYTTTDIACAKYRYEHFHADRILYYIDSRQHQHLQQAWSIVRKAGYVPEQVTLEHHMFGMMLGKDGKPFKTREGGTIKLSALLDEAVERASQLIHTKTKNGDFTDVELQNVINAVAIGAIKYADLSKHRTTDYVFDWDSMLAFEGNTAPYMQYAYTRVLSIFRKSGLHEINLTEPLILLDLHEKRLAVRLLQLEETLYTVAREGTPHIMCAYLYEVAGLFSSFYETCPILNAENETIRQSRLKLSLLTAKTLKIGLDTLGIQTIDKM